MALMKVDETAWGTAFGHVYPSVFFDPKYLNIVKGAFKYDIHYYIYNRANKLAFAAALFSINGRISVPDGFTYSSIFIDKNVGDIIYIQIWEELLNLLKTKFKRIAFRLPPGIIDIRPFIWTRFKIINSYTYYRKSTDLLTNKMQKKVNKVEENLNFVVGNATDEDINLNLIKCFSYSLPKKLYQNYKNLFTSLSKDGYLKSFCVYRFDKLVTSQIAIIDVTGKILLTISINELNDRTVINYLNYKIYEWCLGNDIDTVDMVGANTKGIANFKYSFNALLTPYFLVQYSYSETILEMFIGYLKYYVKRILRR